MNHDFKHQEIVQRMNRRHEYYRLQEPRETYAAEFWLVVIVFALAIALVW